MGPKKKDKGNDGDALTRIAIVGADKYVPVPRSVALRAPRPTAPAESCDGICAMHSA